MATYTIDLNLDNVGSVPVSNFKASTLLQDHEGKSRIYNHGDTVTVDNTTPYGRYFIRTYVPMGIAVLNA